MRAVVVGAGVAGLGTALAVAGAGHEVLLLERDRTPMPASPEAAFAWDRAGAPQVRHSHAFLARARNLLRSRAPAVLEALLRAGATEQRFTDQLPETLTDHDPRPGDDDLVALACRRTTFEWVLRRYVLALPRVELRDGVAIDGLVAAGGRITGVRSGRDVVVADLVVDASGPRSRSRSWLAGVGIAEPPEREHASGIVYLSRFYELVGDRHVPTVAGPIAGDLGYLKYAVFLGDNRTFSITLACDATDAELRRVLADADRFERVVAQLAAAQPWRNGRSAPITDVHLMAGLRNRKRTFVDDDGSPIAPGFVAIGDAAVCTNPLYGRGCSLALVHAFALADAIASAPGAIERELHIATERDLDPWFRAAVLQDREAAGPATATATSAVPLDADGSVNPRVWARAVFRDGLLPAVRTSPIVFRAFLRWFNLLAAPDALVNDPDVLAEALRSYDQRAERPPPEPLGPPTRAALLAGLTTSSRCPE